MSSSGRLIRPHRRFRLGTSTSRRQRRRSGRTSGRSESSSRCKLHLRLSMEFQMDRQKHTGTHRYSSALKSQSSGPRTSELLGQRADQLHRKAAGCRMPSNADQHHHNCRSFRFHKMPSRRPMKNLERTSEKLPCSWRCNNSCCHNMMRPRDMRQDSYFRL